MTTKLIATWTDTQTCKLLSRTETQLPKQSNIGSNSVTKKRETSTAWLKWMMTWLNAIWIDIMILRLLRTKQQLRPLKSTGLDGDSSREETLTVPRSSLTTKLSAIWKSMLISNKHLDSISRLLKDIGWNSDPRREEIQAANLLDHSTVDSTVTSVLVTELSMLPDGNRVLSNHLHKQLLGSKLLDSLPTLDT